MSNGSINWYEPRIQTIPYRTKIPRSLVLGIFITLTPLFCSCNNEKENEKGTGAGNAAPVSASAGSSPLSFIDDDGRTVVIDKPAKRIISLYSAHTENLFWLGAGASVIGGHKTCTWPPEAAPLAVYDYTGDPEYVIAAEPDLVLTVPRISRAHPDYLSALEKAGITVVSLYTDVFDDFDEYIRRLAALCGAGASGRLAEFHERLEAIRATTAAFPESARKRVFFEAAENHMRTAAPLSFPALAIEFAGGVNTAVNAEPVYKGGSMASFGLERVMEIAGTIDVYIAQRGAMNRTVSIESIKARPGYGAVQAVNDGRIYIIDERLISSPTARFLDGIEELAGFMYPELQWEQ
ncbi:MAG: ABC transporter substrate-binding protein [Treponema sp.]|jgi:iron complex transport system substrate-binding protein|nr:ABC transporter substrate-binding protein [Treponema sp.]